MSGATNYTPPSMGRTHSVTLSGQAFEIRPRFSLVNIVESYFEVEGISQTDKLSRKDLNAIYELCLDFLPAEARVLFEDELDTAQQRLVCSKLYRIHMEINDGIARPNPGEEGTTLEQAEHVVSQLEAGLAIAQEQLAALQMQDAAPPVPVESADPT